MISYLNFMPTPLNSIDSLINNFFFPIHAIQVLSFNFKCTKSIRCSSLTVKNGKKTKKKELMKGNMTE